MWVKESFRKQKIASKLLKTLVETAKQKYNITCVNGTTYNGENKMPYSWYKRIGFKKVEDLFLKATQMILLKVLRSKTW